MASAPRGFCEPEPTQMVHVIFRSVPMMHTGTGSAAVYLNLELKRSMSLSSYLSLNFEDRSPFTFYYHCYSVINAFICLMLSMINNWLGLISWLEPVIRGASCCEETFLFCMFSMTFRVNTTKAVSCFTWNHVIRVKFKLTKQIFNGLRFVQWSPLMSALWRTIKSLNERLETDAHTWWVPE